MFVPSSIAPFFATDVVMSDECCAVLHESGCAALAVFDTIWLQLPNGASTPLHMTHDELGACAYITSRTGDQHRIGLVDLGW